MLNRLIEIRDVGPFAVPAHPEERSRASESCVRAVFAGEYTYPRKAPERIHSFLDVGCNVGAALVWADTWWPGIQSWWAFDPNLGALAIAESNARRYLRRPVAFRHAAVTTAKSARFRELTDWGASGTYGATSGAQVPVVHPSKLPAADVLKCDAEGVGAEVFAHYPHWSQVKVALYESHHEEERDVMAKACEAAGLRMVRGNPEGPACDVRVWAR
jgi:FkbM family methyltransferase